MNNAPKEDSIERLIKQSGLSSLPIGAKVALKDQLTAEIEDEIGERVKSRMTKDQIAKFSDLMSGDHEYLVAWLRDNDPEFSNTIVDETIQKLEEYAQELFIDLNVPGYRADVYAVLARRQNQLTTQAPEILAAAGNTLSE